MPHSIFLGSALATQDRLASSQPETEEDGLPIGKSNDSKASSEYSESIQEAPSKFMKYCKDARTSFLSNFRAGSVPVREDEAKSHSERENNSYAHVAAHIYHGTVDIVVSLLGFAVVINAL